MRDEYDFANSLPNPYKRAPKQKITIQVDTNALNYFKTEAARTGIPYQSIINYFLCTCAEEGKRLQFS